MAVGLIWGAFLFLRPLVLFVCCVLWIAFALFWTQEEKEFDSVGKLEGHWSLDVPNLVLDNENYFFIQIDGANQAMDETN